MFQAPSPVVEFLAPVEEYISPVPLAHTAPAPVVDFIAPSARTQFFSLSPASSDAETHFPAVTGTKSRRGIETPTSSLSRRRLVDEAGHVLDVQVERVMRASVARLGYEWRRTKKREKQLAETLLHLSHELQSCPSHGHTVTLLGMLAGDRGPIPAPSAIAGVVSRVGSLERSVEFHEDAILELERQGSLVDSLVAKVEEMDRLLAQLEQLSDRVAEVERDTAVRFEQAESLVNHVDELARRGQAELEGQLKQLTDTMEVQLHEHLSEFKDTSLEVAELGVELKRRGREFMQFTDFVLEDIKKADQLHDDLKNKVLVLESRVDCSLQEQSERVTNLEQWGDQLSEHLNECLDRVTNLEQWGEELAQSL